MAAPGWFQSRASLQFSSAPSESNSSFHEQPYVAICHRKNCQDTLFKSVQTNVTICNAYLQLDSYPTWLPYEYLLDKFILLVNYIDVRSPIYSTRNHIGNYLAATGHSQVYHLAAIKPHIDISCVTPHMRIQQVSYQVPKKFDVISHILPIYSESYAQ